MAFVIRKTTAHRDRVGRTTTHSTYANASFYVADLARGGRSKAKTYVSWMSVTDIDSRPHGITKFDDEAQARALVDHYPLAFGRGITIVSTDGPEIAAELEFWWEQRERAALAMGESRARIEARRAAR